mgnify:CR=1 FL=1
MQENTAMQPDFFTDSIAGAAGGLAAAVGAAVVFGRKLLKNVTETKVEYTADQARALVLDQMRGELARMGEQNGRLADSLNALQHEVLALRSENADLHDTVRALRSEVATLRAR